MAIKKNTKTIYEKWAPMIEKTTGVKDPEKLAWMTQLAHNQALNEADGWGNGNVMPGAQQGAAGAMGGAYAPYSTLYNTVGVGDARAAGRPALTGADYADNTQLGSGDKFPTLLPLALKVAAKTIGFELVNTTPMAGPTGVLPYLDYVYAGSKQPYGATPAYDVESANPARFQGSKAASLYGLPTQIKFNYNRAEVANTAEKLAALKENLVCGDKFTAANATTAANKVELEFIGWSRIDADPMFKILNGTAPLAEVFDGAAITLEAGADNKGTLADDIKVEAPRMISMLEDSLQGFAGAGREDIDPWFGTYQDGTRLYEPMSRATGELQYARQISLQMFTKNVTVGTIAVSAAVTQEQVTDLQKQWGIDVVKMIENAAVNELSNTINRHITSRLFALGWKNHAKLIEVEGPSANLNLSFGVEDTANPAKNVTPAYAVPQGEQVADGSYVDQKNIALPWKFVTIPENAHFENRDTLYKRITVNFLKASNWILQRGRYGAGTFAVTNLTVATALQSNAQYAFSPIANSISQQGGSLYPAGTLFGMTLYVDPLMGANDCRILVGRKGGKDEPGTHFCPYQLAATARIISEGTFASKVLVKSRYSLVDCGWYPETQYLTFVVDFAGID